MRAEKISVLKKNKACWVGARSSTKKEERNIYMLTDKDGLGGVLDRDYILSQGESNWWESTGQGGCIPSERV